MTGLMTGCSFLLEVGFETPAPPPLSLKERGVFLFGVVQEGGEVAAGAGRVGVAAYRARYSGFRFSTKAWADSWKSSVLCNCNGWR